MIEIDLPMCSEIVENLRAGDEVAISGSVFSARDQACARLAKMIHENRALPINLDGALIYFVGPTPSPDGRSMGSAGPTTSGRMNPFLPALLGHGLRGFIGKGFVSSDVQRALEARGGVYFGAVGGTGALLSQSISGFSVVAFPELISEAVMLLQLVRFPAVVLHDSRGGDLYQRTYAHSRRNL